ncbi:organomercurial lyase MerB [Pseudarthrobacter sp. AL07]|uniref:organomercurial lyase MerB n=1 Tax=unclassified Pseudarthrobacter TaxID=2647000 RepID=UPI00249BC9BA|nr:MULTISPECIES: organomercurial lyase MerB [unclassified Pseudarthrobacter]MDI3196251.1 organomercurial lyase MerB [Pseudarthrobacter sp. AL20]MDI3210310.1 organomercurial lyase MerB [Pseudarthrobacter sp. AL07]
MSTDFIDLTDRLTSPDTGIEPALWLPLLHLLSQGESVAIADLAAVTGRTVPEIRAALAAVPDTEYDGDGRIIGQGLTLRPTPHRLELAGEQLYTWCALDTLIFPALLGTPARIESTCHATGVPVRLSVGASGVTDVEPASAVVSLVNPEDMSSVRSAFCNQVHFFASPEAAKPWLDAHPGGSVVSVAEAHRIGTAMAGSLLDETLPARPAVPGKGAHRCAC